MTSYLKLLFFEVVIWLVKADCLFLIALLSLRERKNMKIYKSVHFFFKKNAKVRKIYFSARGAITTRFAAVGDVNDLTI